MTKPHYDDGRWLWGMLDPHDPDSWFQLVGLLSVLGLIGIVIAAVVIFG